MSSTVINRIVITVTLAFLLCETASAESGTSVVARLYKDFAWQAISAQPELFGEVISNQNKTVLERYFSPELAALLVQDNSCQAKTKGICNLDFDLLFASQDPSVADLEIGDAVAGVVPVKFKAPASNTEVKLDFKVKTVAGKWKIADIVYRNMNGASLRSILSQKAR